MDAAINVHIDSIFSPVRPLVLRAVEHLVQLAGWNCQAVNDPDDAHLCYSPNDRRNWPSPCAGLAPWLHRDARRPVAVDELVAPADTVVERPFPGGGRCDWLATAHFVLCGGGERDEHRMLCRGVPGPNIGEWGLLAQPTVDILAERLRRKLLQRFASLDSPRPKWPQGKTWAFCLTHDCDRVYRFRAADYLRDAARELAKRRIRPSAAALAKAAYCAAAKPLAPNDPLLQSWRNWLKFEESAGIPGTYYVGTWNRHLPQSDDRDVHYDCRDRGIQNIVGQLRRSGFEVGLHSSIRAWEFQRIGGEADLFERHFGFRPAGFRGHYWSIARDNIAKCFAQAQRAGFTYGSALGMNLVHGYRRGSAYPYRPYDATTGEPSGVWEVPPIVMDQSLLLAGDSTQERIESFWQRVDNVQQHQGCLVMDWHSDSLAGGFMENLARHLLPELRRVAGDPSCWLTTPRQLVAWCSRERWAAEDCTAGSASAAQKSA